MAEAEIVNPEVLATIPSTDLVGLEKTLVDVDRLTKQIGPLKAKAESIEGKTAAEYQEIGAVLSEVRSLKKQGVGYFAPFEGVIERAKNWLKIQRQKHEVICNETENTCLLKMKAYERAEVEAALAEQNRLNAERRKQAEEAAEAERKRKAKEIAEAQKAGEIGKREADKQKAEAAAEAERAAENVPEVKVKPNISSTPGYRRSTVWKIEVTDVAEFLRASKERKDLRRFIILDEQALGAEARSIKNEEKFMAAFPGVRCWRE